MAEHIDSQRLRSDVEYRFAYLSKFIGFGDVDNKALHDAAPVLGPLVPVVVDAVYNKLLSFDVTKQVFLERNAGFEGKLESTLPELTTDSEQIKFRKDFLSKYLVKLVTAEYDANFIKYLDHVGKVHTPEGGAQKINVEYIHVGALFAYVGDILINAVYNAGLPRDKELTLIKALNKLLWIQNDLFVKWYQHH